MSSKTMLITGATGKTGRRVVERLQGAGLSVRPGSRSADPAFDWSDQATWPAALDSVDAAYLSYFPDLAAPGAAEVIAAFTAAAVERGVKRLVLLSGRGEPEALRCEQIVRDSGLQWTLVRASWFNQNFSENYFLEPILAGEVALPAGNVPEPFVDVEDIADVAAAALTDDRHVGQLYEVTGPGLWTFEQALGEIARVTGREIRYVPVSVDDYAAALEAAQLPPDLVELVTYLFREVLHGRNASLADGVPRALGRPARSFEDYVRRTAETGVWNAVS
jgi:uncharacterized protein YbjT (DUF2867 family)